MVYKRESPKVDHHEVISGSSINGLPDDVLVHILGFMNPKEAVQTSVLSKRWKHLCKQLTELTYSTKLCPRDDCKRFQKFADWILCSRNHSCSLFNLNVVFCLTIDPQILETLIEYAFSHSLHHLKLDLVKGSKWHFRPNPLTFRSHSLKSLTLCHDWPPCHVLLPEKLNFPSLQSLRLENFEFAASCCGSAEPFSNCHALHTLILERCYNPAVLNISNSTLTNLTISNVYSRQIVLSTPNLSSFSIEGYIDQPLFSTCSLSLLREVYIELCLIRDDPEDLKDLSTVMKWLQVLTNVKILTFHFRATYLMLKKLPNPINMAPQPPSFVRLEAVRLKSTLSDTEELLNTVVEYLLQNSPMNKVDILKGS